MLVKEIQAEGRVSGFFLIMDSQLRTAKNGTFYATLRLGDKTGEIAMKVWELSKEVFNELKIGKVIKVEATAKIFNGSLQLEASGRDDFFQVCQGNQYDPALFLRATDLELDALWSVLEQACAEVQICCYQTLLKHFFANGEFRKKFETSPAALRHHHVYFGGLLEHTVGVTKICLTVATNYPGVNKDLLVTGALLHDVGKLQSYQVGPGFCGTDQGRLVGHLVLGIQMVTEAVAGLRSTSGAEFFPPEYEWPLLHLLTSHHGLKEWGSPVEPASLEACILHHADYLDSEVSKYLEALRKHPADGGNWTSYDQNLQKSVYLPFIDRAEEDEAEA